MLLGALIQRGGFLAPAAMVAIKPPAQGMCPLVTRGEADRRASGSRGPTALSTAVGCCLSLSCSLTLFSPTAPGPKLCGDPPVKLLLLP